LSCAPKPFLLWVIFQIESCAFFLGLPSEHDPTTCAFWVAGIIDRSYCTCPKWISYRYMSPCSVEIHLFLCLSGSFPFISEWYCIVCVCCVLLVNAWVISSFLILWIKLSWTFM
jgi:hypothetical protein